MGKSYKGVCNTRGKSNNNLPFFLHFTYELWYVFRAVLAYTYIINRLNMSIVFLLPWLRCIEYSFWKLRKLEMGQKSHRICKIIEYHQSAKKLYSSLIILLNNNKWKAKSLNILDKYYGVETLIVNYMSWLSSVSTCLVRYILKLSIITSVHSVTYLSLEAFK